MKRYLLGIFYSFPVQLVLLHLKKFQVLLIFWYVMFSTVNGSFMHSFGADSLFLAPEYRGTVDAMSSWIIGIAIAIFIMSWNITTFILFSRHFRFLATTSNPFLKYCINNSIIPLSFIIFYFIRMIQFQHYREFMDGWLILWNLLGFLLGFTIVVLISFFYFFRADKTIIRRLTPVMSDPKLFKSTFKGRKVPLNESRLIHVEWYLNSFSQIKKPREVKHYSISFIDAIFNRHHFAAILSIFIAFMFLILVGFNLDRTIFQLPAGAGITLFFSILIAVSGAFSYFLQSWSIPFLLVLIFGLNFAFQSGLMDPSNKAYGLNYWTEKKPSYSSDSLIQLCNRDSVEADIQNMTAILDKWKLKQGEDKPLLYILNTSGGGNRSANFTMNVLQKLDSISGGTLMDKVFLITGASGGMLGAGYYRELSQLRDKGVDPNDPKYVEDISQDLLNSIFTSMVARDLVTPAQKFKVGDYEYIKDRGYAFERRLNENTRGYLDKSLKEIYEEERNANIPLMLFNSVSTRDGRKMITGTQPMRFLMRPYNDSINFTSADPDAIDFNSFFSNQDPLNLRLLTALRMNATFPYVLPNVWLPTDPKIDVMDAGLRDNYGPETAFRFLQVFKKWIKENTGGVVLIQVRDRKIGGWDFPYSDEDVTGIFTKPLLLLQYNWYKMQEYNQNDLMSFVRSDLGDHFTNLVFQYVPKKEDAGAALNFHLTKRERLNIRLALFSDENKQSFQKFHDFHQMPERDQLTKKNVIVGKPLAER